MTTDRNHEALVVAQFGPQAAAYVTSVVHAQGEDLDRLVALVKGATTAHLLDLGCGGGHVSFHVAPEVGDVVAYDLSPDMLAAVAAETARRGLKNIAGRQGPAEAVPFAKAEFDIVLSRYSAHHWRDVPAALREMRRVLKPGGRAAIADAVAPEAPMLDTFLQTIEMLRDPSHARDYSITQWRAMAMAAGFTVGTVTPLKLRLDFASWIARMKTPPAHVAAIRSLQSCLSEPVRRHFAVEEDGSFLLDTMVMELS